MNRSMYVVHNIENGEFSLLKSTEVLFSRRQTCFLIIPDNWTWGKIGCKVCYGILFQNCELLSFLQ